MEVLMTARHKYIISVYKLVAAGTNYPGIGDGAVKTHGWKKRLTRIKLNSLKSKHNRNTRRNEKQLSFSLERA